MERAYRQIRLLGGRFVFCLLILAVAAGCTTLHKVPLEPEKITSELKRGDQVRVLTKDGDESEFVLTSVSPDKLTGESQSVEVKDIAKVEKREISVFRSAGAVGGSLLAFWGGFIVLVLLAL